MVIFDTYGYPAPVVPTAGHLLLPRHNWTPNVIQIPEIIVIHTLYLVVPTAGHLLLSRHLKQLPYKTHRAPTVTLDPTAGHPPLPSRSYTALPPKQNYRAPTVTRNTSSTSLSSTRTLGTYRYPEFHIGHLLLPRKIHTGHLLLPRKPSACHSVHRTIL